MVLIETLVDNSGMNHYLKEALLKYRERSLDPDHVQDSYAKNEHHIREAVYRARFGWVVWALAGVLVVVGALLLRTLSPVRMQRARQAVVLEESLT